MHWIIVDEGKELEVAGRSLFIGSSRVAHAWHWTGQSIRCRLLSTAHGSSGASSCIFSIASFWSVVRLSGSRYALTGFPMRKDDRWGLEAKGPTQFGGGSILDPNNGKTYQLSATYEPDGTLRARIFEGIPLLGRTEILTRVDVRSLTGQC